MDNDNWLIFLLWIIWLFLFVTIMEASDFSSKRHGYIELGPTTDEESISGVKAMLLVTHILVAFVLSATLIYFLWSYEN